MNAPAYLVPLPPLWFMLDTMTAVRPTSSCAVVLFQFVFPVFIFCLACALLVIQIHMQDSELVFILVGLLLHPLATVCVCVLWCVVCSVDDLFA